MLGHNRIASIGRCKRLEAKISEFQFRWRYNEVQYSHMRMNHTKYTQINTPSMQWDKQINKYSWSKNYKIHDDHIIKILRELYLSTTYKEILSSKSELTRGKQFWVLGTHLRFQFPRNFSRIVVIPLNFHQRYLLVSQLLGLSAQYLHRPLGVRHVVVHFYVIKIDHIWHRALVILF